MDMHARFIEEAPRLLKKDDDHAFKVADDIATWIWNHATRDAHKKEQTARVIGVYGGRGSGKTSVLYTVLDGLRVRAEKREPGKMSPCVLPVCETEDYDFARCVYSPAETRDCDDLLFGLLDHLQKCYRPEGTNVAKKNEGPFDMARRAEVHRKELNRMLDWAKETATSTNQVPKDLVKQYEESAKTTTLLRESFEEIIKLYTSCPHSGGGNDEQKGPATLILPIDDVDLQPHRTLELLELLHIFLHRTNIVVLVGADRDLMLRSVADNLQRRHLNQTGLAGALIAKYVPYQWNVPAPTSNMRFKGLWKDDSKRDESALRYYWQDAAVKGGAEKSLEPLLPTTYRGLIALHNRLVSLWGEVHGEANAPWRLRLEDDLRNSIGIVREDVDAVFSLCVAVDVQRPELNVLQTLLTQPDLFRQILIPDKQQSRDADYGPEPLPASIQAIAAQMGRMANLFASQALRPTGTLSNQDHDLPLLDRLGPPYLDGRLVGEARALLQALTNAIIAMRDRSRLATPEMRLLAISLNADAYALAKPLRDQMDYDAEQIIHVDLRAFGDGRRASVDELRQAQDEWRKEIDKHDLRSRTGQIDLVARAQFPLVTWLGAYLPWQMRVVPQQMRHVDTAEAEAVAYRAPYELRRPSDTNDFALLTPLPRKFAKTGKEAVVIVDLLGRAKPDDVNAFYAADGQLVETEHKYRLRLTEQTSLIEPAKVVPILQDVGDFAYQLRQRNVQTIHLGMALPVEIAFFVGRELRAWGEVRLYEYIGGRYEYVFNLV